MGKKLFKANFHLPGLFEFFEFYKLFLPLYFEHREYFFDWCDISSIYGAPEGCLWGGGRTGVGTADAKEILQLLEKYNISARLTFSNSLLEKEHLLDKTCNKLCSIFADGNVHNGVIVHSEILLEYLKKNYPELYLVSSTTKVLTDFSELKNELTRNDFKYVVPDFRLNKNLNNLIELSDTHKNKIEFLCNECCWFYCNSRKECYENVSKKNLGVNCSDHICSAPDGSNGYSFSKAMKNPAFISTDDIQKVYLPNGFSNFKIEGRNLGSAIILEFLLYYLTKPEYHIQVREALYLDSMLDLF